LDDEKTTARLPVFDWLHKQQAVPEAAGTQTEQLDTLWDQAPR
jgi:hypothetical protein